MPLEHDCKHLDIFSDSAPFSGSETVHQCALLSGIGGSTASLGKIEKRDPDLDLTHWYNTRECPYALRLREAHHCPYYEAK